MGAQPSGECLLLSSQDPESLEFLWPVLGLSLLAAAASGSPSPSPCGPGVLELQQGVPGVKGGGGLEAGAGGPSWGAEEAAGSRGARGGHLRANRAR